MVGQEPTGRSRTVSVIVVQYLVVCVSPLIWRPDPPRKRFECRISESLLQTGYVLQAFCHMLMETPNDDAAAAAAAVVIANKSRM